MVLRRRLPVHWQMPFDLVSKNLLKRQLIIMTQVLIHIRLQRKYLQTFIYLGILSDVLNQVHHITRDENIFLLSDAGELIYLITEKDQTPFIYEKVGNTFENFMIDEFQDTSIIQWKNFRHLIDNSMAQGFENLVVGDIKQSIYRWRNSDWKTLAGS